MTTISRRALAASVAALIMAATAVIGVPIASASTARVDANCSTVVKGASWKIKGLGSGSNYTLKLSGKAGAGATCAATRAWVIKVTHETESGQVLKGLTGYKCESLASKISGDTKVYDGVCQKGTPAVSIYVWAPKPG
jgi:hypothetical protein